jgi:hypothetical protein
MKCPKCKTEFDYSEVKIYRHYSSWAICCQYCWKCTHIKNCDDETKAFIIARQIS